MLLKVLSSIFVINLFWFFPAGWSMITPNKWEYLLYLVPVFYVLLDFIYLLNYFFVKDGKPVDTVEFMPPEGLNSLEIAYIYRRNINDYDVLSLVISFICAGYMKMIKSEPLDDVGGYKIIKLKEYEGTNIIEKNYLNGLFLDEEGNSCNEVNLRTFKNNFYKMNSSVKRLTKKKLQNKIFGKNLELSNAFLILRVMITNLIIVALPLWKYNETYGQVAVVLNICFFGTWLCLGDVISDAIFEADVNTLKATNKFTKIFDLLLILLAIALYGYIDLMFAFNQSTLYTFGYMLGFLCIFEMLSFAILSPKRTTYGGKLYGKIKGFRDFLETARKDELYNLTKTNPRYLYDILPYAFALKIFGNSNLLTQLESQQASITVRTFAICFDIIMPSLEEKEKSLS